MFDTSSAKPLLWQDVRDKIHLTMEPADFQDSRLVYRGFKPKKFRERICQEVRYQKSLFHLELKRSQEKMKIQIGSDAFVE